MTKQTRQHETALMALSRTLGATVVSLGLLLGVGVFAQPTTAVAARPASQALAGQSGEAQSLLQLSGFKKGHVHGGFRFKKGHRGYGKGYGSYGRQFYGGYRGGYGRGYGRSFSRFGAYPRYGAYGGRKYYNGPRGGYAKNRFYFY
ncbi:MAG: hypothetical protein AAF530_22455 [Pseudomonadota bacterium]